MAAKYKLTYFPTPALGEPVRWLLSYGNLEFEDYRFQLEDWPSIKPTTPFGQAPVLEIDGKITWQSIAICRHLARQLNLIGKDEWEGFQIDMIVDTISDLRKQLGQYQPDQNETKEQYQRKILFFFLSRLDTIVAENEGYFVGGKLTWADIYFIAVSEYLQKKVNGLDFIEDYPNLKALKEKVLEIPQIKTWIAKRPPDCVL